MQTDITLGRTVAPATPFSQQASPSATKSKNEEFNSYVDLENGNDPDDAGHKRTEMNGGTFSQAPNTGMDEKDPSLSPPEDFSLTNPSRDLSGSRLAQTDHNPGAKHQTTAQSLGNDSDGAEAPVTIRDPVPSALVTLANTQNSGTRPVLDNVMQEVIEQVAENDPTLRTVQGEDTNAELAGLRPAEAPAPALRNSTQIDSPAATTGNRGPDLAGLVQISKPGETTLATPDRSLPQQSSGTPDLPILGQQKNLTPPSALPATQTISSRIEANALAALPQPSAPGPVAGDATTLGQNRATPAIISGNVTGANILFSPTVSKILASSETPELNLIGPVEASLQNGSGRPVEGQLVTPQTARLIASQMADALINIQGNKVDISLRPPELGRVRMVVSTSETGVLISIAAERPETLDLMRRHIDQLADEFRKLGYVGIGFEFSDGHDTDHDNDGFDADPAQLTPDEETEPDNHRGEPDPGPKPVIHASGLPVLDLRL